MKFKSLIVALILSFTSTVYAAGFCTASFISPDGYIVTAAHCASKDIVAEYIKNGVKHRARAKAIVIDHNRDVMILKINVTNVHYFILAPEGIRGESIATIGFPLPETLGFNQKFFVGTLNAPYGNKHEMTLYGGGGISGAPVFDSNSEIVGVFVSGYFAKGSDMSFMTQSANVTSIIYLARQSHVPVLVLTDNPEYIGSANKAVLFDRNSDKIIQLFINFGSEINVD